MQFTVTDRDLLSYTVVTVNSAGAMIDLTPITKKIVWSGSLQGAAMSLTVELSAYEGLADMVDTGDQLILYGPNLEEGGIREVMRGYILQRRRDTTGGGGMVLTAYDLLIYLLNNRDDYIFRNVTATDVVKTVCGDWDIPLGEVASTQYVINKMIARNMTLYDMIVKALVLTREGDGTKFFVRAKEGKVHLVPKAHNPVTWVLAYGSNILGATHEEDVLEMRNRISVRTHGDEEEKPEILATVDDEALVKKYGVFQEIHSVDGNAVDKFKAQEIARNLLKKLAKVKQTATVTAIGVNTLYPGDPVIVEEPITGLKGTYYVKDITVTVTGSNATMEVSLSWDDDLEADIEEGEG